MNRLLSWSLPAAAGVLALAALTDPAAAQPPACGEREPMIQALEQQFDERRSVVAVATSGELVEVLVSPAGTWTILVTRPQSATCLVAQGDGWQPLDTLRSESSLRGF